MKRFRRGLRVLGCDGSLGSLSRYEEVFGMGRRVCVLGKGVGCVTIWVRVLVCVL